MATRRKMNRDERRKLMVRIVCCAVAVVMVGSVLIAALMSQVY